MKIAHFADLHYCKKHLQWVDKAFAQAVSIAINERCDVAVIAGDSFDAAIELHQPAVYAYLQQIRRITDARIPVLVLQGTYSHDRPGSLDVLRTLDPGLIQVADEPDVFELVDDPGGYRWHATPNAAEPDSVAARICCIPSLNKADPDVIEVGPREWIAQIAKAWSWSNRRLSESGIPTALVTHGTVTGCKTESSFAMVSPDHEFSLDTLASAECGAVMLGHIHKHQKWEVRSPEGLPVHIVYSGSIARLVHGHHDPTGFLIWQHDGNKWAWTHHEVESRHLIDVVFEGQPDLEELAQIADKMGSDDHVRVRYSIDEEHVSSVDRDRIAEIFGGAAGLKIEGTINRIVTVRAKGIGAAPTIADKVRHWSETSDNQHRIEEVIDRLESTRTTDKEDIVSSLLKRR